MSLSNSHTFGVESMPIDGLESGTSILLTGDDHKALKTVFARLVAAEEDEHSVVLATDQRGHAARRGLDAVKTGAGSRTSVLAAEGRGNGDELQVVDTLSDLTAVGMELSTMVATAQQSVDRFRTGIVFCSTLCDEVEDARSVYRFLNSNFLTELRRGDGIGVCAFDTSADLETDIDSMLAGMETSFTGRIDIESVTRSTATLQTTGLSGIDSSLDVSL
ncbi:hypothetical protein G6M89_04400 [Natronolimnobius sp. AArcel1]|uniref:DUF7504 family protein n=1 Tax=Natronolimnobius sp. AArcel1 TaxID=1679093 RepID=UPI0013EA2D3D|nr:hypothetical protein [Natronolimnobius sp. AArcel1]NGM68256.1 hypothetical protein [Natronolimnobius sp. AArcel1]